MTAGFRPFRNVEEEAKAAALIGAIDRGEKWVFEGAGGSLDFGGFLKRLRYSSEGVLGVFSACVYAGKLRVQIAFDTDMPEEQGAEILDLLREVRKEVDTDTSVWYRPENRNLEAFLANDLPWKAKGHKTREFTAAREDFSDTSPVLPSKVQIIPFEERYLSDTCAMLDASLAHTFDDPAAKVFTAKRDSYLKEWTEKARSSDCCVMLEDGMVAGAYVLKGPEIDIMAVSANRQRRGLGRQLLRHAIAHILAVSDADPHLYCIDSNSRATEFYLREGLKVTGHSGYLFMPAVSSETNKD